LREAFAIYRQFPIAVLLGRHRRNAQIGDAVYHQLLSVARQIVDSECNSHYNEIFFAVFFERLKVEIIFGFAVKINANFL
jgi:hypothetical protein